MTVPCFDKQQPQQAPTIVSNVDDDLQSPIASRASYCSFTGATNMESNSPADFVDLVSAALRALPQHELTDSQVSTPKLFLLKFHYV